MSPGVKTSFGTLKIYIYMEHIYYLFLKGKNISNVGANDTLMIRQIIFIKNRSWCSDH